MANFYSFYPPAGSGVANPSVGVNGAVAPTSSTEVGGINPSGNLQPLQTDAAGALIVTPAVGSVQHVIVDSSALPTDAATSANQTSQITQETAIAASVASIDGKTVHVDTGNVTVVSSTLPTGASTSALQTTGNTSLSSIDGKLNSLGQKTMAASVPVVIASDQSAVPVSGTVTTSDPANGTPGTAAPAQATQVGGTDGTNLRALKTNAAGNLMVDASVAVINNNVTSVAGTAVTAGNGTAGAGSQRVVIASDNTAFTVNVGTSGLPTGAATEATLAKLPLAQGSTTSGQSGTLTQGAVTTAAPTYTTGQTSPLSLTTTGALRTDASGSTQPVSGTVAATQSGTWTVQPGNTANTTPWLVKEVTSATATNSNVSGSATSVTLLASNANRLGATIYNDSTAILYVNLAGNAASITNYTVQLVSGAYYELPTPHLYTGAITGIWASATGAARVTELP